VPVVSAVVFLVSLGISWLIALAPGARMVIGIKTRD
jgi:hypothetical protein